MSYSDQFAHIPMLEWTLYQNWALENTPAYFCLFVLNLLENFNWNVGLFFLMKVFISFTIYNAYIHKELMVNRIYILILESSFALKLVSIISNHLIICIRAKGSFLKSVNKFTKCSSKTFILFWSLVTSIFMSFVLVFTTFFNQKNK